MRSVTEANRWLRDAEACLASAQWALDVQDYRVAVQNAQLCVEHSAKAVIAQLAEPLWRHDPSPQLRRLLETHEELVIQRCGEEMPDALRQLARDAEQAAPWHGWSTYGRESEDAGWLAAVDLCTPEIAKDLVQRARRALPVAKSFTAQWSTPALPPQGKRSIILNSGLDAFDITQEPDSRSEKVRNDAQRDHPGHPRPRG